MDVGELLSYKPKRGGKGADEDDEEAVPPPKAPKRSREQHSHRPEAVSSRTTRPGGSATGRGTTKVENGLTDEEKLRLLRDADEELEPDIAVGETLDAGSVRRLVLSFEKKVLKNQEMRIKFPDLPEKFMESELELNDEIQSFHIIATAPEYYTILIELNAIQTLVGLLSHDNSDLSVAVIDLLQELTDVDALNENEEEAEKLVDALLAEQVLALLVQNLERLDEKVQEDAEGVHNTLAIVENMSEIRNEEICRLAGEQGLLQWILKRLRVRPYDANKLYASEVLAVLLQGHEGNRRLLGEKDGIDILLQALAYYKRRDPGGPDEEEMMENTFDCLCSSLMYPPNRERFLKGEGLQLMILMLKEKKLSRRSALKVLNHAMSNKEGAENCMKFVEVYGLRSLFPAFMKTPKKSRKSDTGEKEHVEHVCSIIASLFRNVHGNGRERLVGKFVENDHEKVERLVELHLSYLQRDREMEETLRMEKRMSATVETPEMEVENYLRRLDAGLFTLQMVDYITLELCLCDTSSVRSRISSLLNLHGDSLQTVKRVMMDYVDKMSSDGEGTATSTANIQQEKLRITAMVDEL